jgi:hypothetical protein
VGEEKQDKTLDREVRLNQLYLAVIDRYSDYIEQHEHLSVAELPKLVTPRSDLVLKKAEELKGRFGSYSYNSSFLEASLKAFDFVRDEIDDVVMPLEFWLTPDETLEFRVGDTVDKNALLCSLLIALGNPSAKVLVCVNSPSRRVLTYHSFNDKIYVMEFGKEIKDFASRDELVKTFETDDDATIYEFDDKMYIDLD